MHIFISILRSFKYYSIAITISLFWASAANSQPIESGISVFDIAAPAVVVISAKGSESELQGSGVAFRYGLDEKRKPFSTWIATNAHVVQSATSVMVKFGELQYAAKIEYADTEFDLAILSVNGLITPKIAQFSDSTGSQIGTHVFAIGSPLGLRNSITDGLISGIRENNGVKLIQTSAAISKGNSGGGLFDTKGKLIGITTFKIKDGENINFAVDATYITSIDEAILAAKLIRVGHTRPSQIRNEEERLDDQFIESSELIKWILRQKTANGSQLSYYIENIVMRGIRAEGKIFGTGNPEFDNILEKFLRTRPRIKSSETQSPELIRLTCPMHASNDGSFKFDLNIVADIKNSTVNGNPATITESNFIFKSGKDMNFTAIVNRYSGRASISSINFPNMLQGSCTKFEERKF